MFEIEIKIDLNLVTGLLNHLMNTFPEVEIEVSESGLRFYLDLAEEIDVKLESLEKVLDKFEKTRMDEDQIPLTVRNIGGPDRDMPQIRVGRFIFIQPNEKIDGSRENTAIAFTPSHSFGTGAHPSTALALIALEEFYTPKPGYPDPVNSSVLDAGTGSGILALAAANLGTGPILAVDSSSAAIEAARINISANNFSEQIKLLRTPLEKVEGRFDLILANLAPSVLLRSASLLVKLMTPGGKLIVAGFTNPQTPNMLKSMNKAGVLMAKSYSRSGWSALSFEKST
ncbi:MAG: 50S ribosomal protein L11 methyltransferase [Candidatus Adiutricales bacterium]